MSLKKPERDKKIIENLLMFCTYEFTAKELGISKQRVHMITLNAVGQDFINFIKENRIKLSETEAYTKEQHKKSYHKNIEKSRKRQREYYHRNAKKCNERSKKYREANKEIIKERQKKYYKKNREKLIAYSIQWRKDNQERSNKYFRDRRRRMHGKNLRYDKKLK